MQQRRMYSTAYAHAGMSQVSTFRNGHLQRLAASRKLHVGGHPVGLKMEFVAGADGVLRRNGCCAIDFADESGAIRVMQVTLPSYLEPVPSATSLPEGHGITRPPNATGWNHRHSFICKWRGARTACGIRERAHFSTGSRNLGLLQSLTPQMQQRRQLTVLGQSVGAKWRSPRPSDVRCTFFSSLLWIRMSCNPCCLAVARAAAMPNTIQGPLQPSA